MSNVTSTEVVSFWREAGPERWFGKDEGFDLTIRTRFLAIHEGGGARRVALWEESREGALGLVILLDQFPRERIGSFACSDINRHKCPNLPKLEPAIAQHDNGTGGDALTP